MPGTDAIVKQVAVVSQGITGIGTVYDYHPYFSNGDEFPAAWIWADSISEKRRGYGGVGAGKKLVTHTIHMAVHQTATDSAEGESPWRQFLDNIRATWRANQLLGGIVERWGEDIEVESDTFKVGDMVQFHATITSTAWEEITG